MDDAERIHICDLVITLLRNRGPLLGIDLVAETGRNVLDLASAIGSSSAIFRGELDSSYLRMDSKAPDQARISPSFLRKFISYTVFGLDKLSVSAAVAELKTRHGEISESKRKLALGLAREICATISGSLKGRFCAAICGDVVYGMAHESPRREHSTEIPVRGSDIDLVVIIDDEDQEFLEVIEKRILKEKYLWLRRSDIREEIDFVVKTVSHMTHQLELSSFRDKIAAKILWESEVLIEVGDIWQECKKKLEHAGLIDYFNRLQVASRVRQKTLENLIYSGKTLKLDAESESLFLSAELDELGEFSRSRQMLIRTH